MCKEKDDSEINYIKRFLENIYTKDDFDRFIHAVRENIDREAIDSYATEIWHKSLRLTSHDQENKEFAFSELNLIVNDKTKKRLRRNILKIASVAASIIIVFGLLYSGFIKDSFQKVHEPVYVSVLTTTGETKTVVLPDGSTVTLNACSRLFYPEKFEKERRLIELTGEAFFHITKNKKIPFIVKTTHFNVKVLGTEFNVRAYQDADIFSVGVCSGKVQVDLPDAMTRLVTNEIMRINSQDQTFSKERNEHNIAVWRSGRLQFHKTPIREVAKELERIFNYKMHFKSGQTFDNLITGEHSSNDFESILASIVSVTGIHYSINENDKEILFYKE